MKKYIPILLSLILCAVILIGSTIGTHAALAPLRVGDLDFDYDISIIDATKIQRWLAKYDIGTTWYPDELIDALCDADGDGEASILDVTTIQRLLAAMSNSFVNRDIWDYYVADAAHHSSSQISFDRWADQEELCIVGEPVTFTAQVRYGSKPRKATLRVDGVTVEEREISGFGRQYFQYTFDKEGTYQVRTEIECRYGVKTADTHHVIVKSLPSDGRPVITGAVFYDMSRMESGDGVLTVTAAGEAPFEYSYVIYKDIKAIEPETVSADDKTDPEDPDPEEEPVPMPDPYHIRTGYIKDNQINVLSLLGEEPYSYGMGNIYIDVTVRDAKGTESETVTARYSYYMLVA